MSDREKWRLFTKATIGDGCWEWTRSVTSGGYGSHYFEGKTQNAHRVAYALCVGDPGELYVDHLCRNRRCVRPDHLEAVSNWENVRRGTSYYAKNATVTHCPQGHEYSEENTYVCPRGRRNCRACRYEQGRRRRGHA